MDFTERLQLYLEGGMIDEKDVRDVNAIIAMFKEKYQIELCEENADTFIAHICAAYGRNATHEEVDPLPEELLAQIKELASYELSLEILKEIMNVTANSLNQTEQEYALLHINNLIANLNEHKEQ